MADYVCVDCGQTYEGYAEYCNVCGSTRFERVLAAPSPSPSLRSDPTALIIQGSLWLIGLVVWVNRSRDLHALFWTWALTAFLGLVAGLITRNLRAAGLFAGLGVLFFGVAAALG